MSGAFSKGEIVWAKIRGFPWWPAMIAKIFEKRSDDSKKTEFLVNFIGENSHATLAFEKICKYKDFYSMYGEKVKQRKLIDAIEETDKILKENGQNGWKETNQNQPYNNGRNEINLKNHEKASKNNNEIKENTNKNIENGKELEEFPQKEEKDTNKKGILHKRIVKQKKNEEKSGKESPDTEKIEQKITRLFQKNNDFSVKKKGRKWGKRKCLKPDFFQLEESVQVEEKPEKTEEKTEENIVIPSKTVENPCLEDDKTPNYKKLLKDLWFCLDLTKKTPPLDNEISSLQCQIKEFLDKITQEFELCKKNREHQDSLQIYIQGYGSFLAGIDYILKINENTPIYKRHFQYIHSDLKLLYCDLKNFIYLNYLKPELPQEKIARNLGFFESFKENSSEKGKLSLELSEDFNENRFKKKFVVKMAQTFQSNYGIDKEKSQRFALKIHSSLVKESNSEHIRNKGIKLLKILKNKEITLINEEDLMRKLEAMLKRMENFRNGDDNSDL